MAKLVHDLCTKSSSNPRSTKVSRNLSADFKRHHLKPFETMLGTDLPQKWTWIMRHFWEPDFSLLFCLVRNNPKPEMSWLRRGGIAWLQMEPNLWYFPFVSASRMWTFPWPLGRECRLVTPCGVNIFWSAFQFVLAVFPLKEERKAN